MSSATAVTDGTFQKDVLQSSEPVLVDFWATWCQPCRMVAPVVEEIASENTGKLKVLKLDVDENQNTAMQYGVSSIPTLILFKDGEPAARLIGAKPKAALLEEISAHL
jgi:thioredoxin 1